MEAGAAGQIDRNGRWTIKRGRQRETPTDDHKRQPEIAVPMFGYKNHVGIDRECRFCGALSSLTRPLMTAVNSNRNRWPTSF